MRRASVGSGTPGRPLLGQRPQLQSQDAHHRVFGSASGRDPRTERPCFQASWLLLKQRNIVLLRCVVLRPLVHPAEKGVATPSSYCHPLQAHPFTSATESLLFSSNKRSPRSRTITSLAAQQTLHSFARYTLTIAVSVPESVALWLCKAPWFAPV
jgi:hypothetical protein